MSAAADKTAFEDTEYDPEGIDVPVRARGSETQPTERNPALEDRETAESDDTGRIPKRASHIPPMS